MIQPLHEQKMVVKTSEVPNKLSPRDMHAFDKKAEEANNYFICTICLKVVVNPKECQNCNNLFCMDCISKWDTNLAISDKILVGSKICPMQCKDPRYTAIHRFSNSELMNKKFRCPNKKNGCKVNFQRSAPDENASSLVDNDFNMTYEQALDHVSKCQYNKMQCQLNCGVEFYNGQMKDHMQVCQNFMLQCQECEISFIRKEQSSHDCVKALKAKLKRHELDLKELGFENLEDRPFCQLGHQMHINRGNPYQKGNVYCDACFQKHIKTDLEGHEFYYRCSQCQQDKCRACVLI